MSDDSYHLLVSVAGDFPSEILPVYYHYSGELVRHLLFHDDARRDRRIAERIYGGIRRFERERSPRIQTLLAPLDEHNPAAAAAMIERIGQHVGGDYSRVIFNTTGTHGALLFDLACRLRSLGATILTYDRFENRCETIRGGATREFFCRRSDIRTHLTLMGYEILQTPDPKELEKRRDVVLKLGLQLERYKEYVDSYVRLRSPQKVHGYDDIKKLLRSIGKLEDQSYLQGTLFEEYIYFLLGECDCFDDLLTGVSVRFEEGVENEFDILMIRDNHLHTIECKLVKRLDGEHFVYKTDRILRYLDHDGRAMILSVGAPNTRSDRRGRTHKQFTEGDKARARHAEIRIFQQERFDPKEFLVEVIRWFVEPYPRNDL